jgi:hypothetical protein
MSIDPESSEADALAIVIWGGVAMCRTPARDDDTPLRLEVAAKLAFPGGGISAASLRTEARRGRLAIERIAGKDFTTLRAIQQMRASCVVKEQDSGSGQPTVEKKNNESSRTADDSIALASALRSLQKLKKSCRNSSPTGTTRAPGQPQRGRLA